MRKSSIAIVLLFVVSSVTAQQTIRRALFLGNSYTFVNDLPGLIARIRQELAQRRRGWIGGSQMSALRSLVGLLTKLLAMCAAQGLPTDVVRRLIADGERLLQAKRRERQAGLPEFQAALRGWLDQLDPSAPKSERKDRFWT